MVQSHHGAIFEHDGSFIVPDFTIKSRCLQTVFFPEDHTGEALAQGLKDALSSWSLKEDKLTCITTDNGQNIAKAISLNDWTRLQCFSHRRHLAIGELLYKVVLLNFRFFKLNILWKKKIVPEKHDLNSKQKNCDSHFFQYRTALLPAISQLYNWLFII